MSFATSSLNPALASAAMPAGHKGLPQSEQGGTSFAALLNSAAARQRMAENSASDETSQASFLDEPEETRTFGFTDLGVFGMQYSSDGRTNSSPTGVAAGKQVASLPSADTQSEVGTSDLPIASLAQIAGSSVPARGERAAAYLSTASIRAAFAVSTSSSSATAVSGSEVSESQNGESTGEPTNVGAAGKVATPQPELQKPGDINLVVSNTDATLTIAVRSQGETADGAVKIRKMLELTAAEFDLRVGEFRLNGMSSIRGGVLGSRTR